MGTDCIFCKIIAGTIPCDKVYEDEQTIAFKDIHPIAPTHILIVPKQHFTSLADLKESELGVVQQLFAVARQIAKKIGVATSGFSTVINSGKDSGQEVFHLHLHLIAGRKLGPMG